MPLRSLSDPELRLRENWESHLHLGADGTPVLPPKYVAEAGPRVWLVDVREDGELTGPLGHVPGVWRLPLARVGEAVSLLGEDMPVVLLCSDGARSTTGARFLRGLGMRYVAAMQGGMIQWRAEGYGSSRATSVLGRMLHAPHPGHGSDGRPLIIGGGKGTPHLTREAVQAHVGDPSKVRRVKLAAFLLNNHTECVDGREDQAVIGTPGGDAGELVLGLAAVERSSGTPVDLDRMPDITRAFADTFGGIYLHTDNKSLHRLTEALRGDPRFADHVGEYDSIDAWEGFINRPPVELRGALLEHLELPAHIGCGHLKLALTNPDVYGTRPELVRAFFRAYYTDLWNGAPDLDLVVLGGDHSEGAVAVVNLAGDVWPFSEVPMIAPSVGGVQMFVSHPQVAGFVRRQTARWLGGLSSILPISTQGASELEEVIADLGGAQAGATLTALANGLPIFTLQFASDGSVAVEESGHIGA